jgi:membrane-bound serine protease (ClpP class)
MCHVLLFLPLIALALFFFLAPDQAAFVSVPLLLIFFWLAWVMWKDLKRPVSTGIEGLVGSRAQVVSKTKYGAKVSLKGELWDAVSRDDLNVGEAVRVTRFERMKLVVHKEKEE